LLADPIRLAHPRTLRTQRNQAALGQLADRPWVLEPVGSAARAWPSTSAARPASNPTSATNPAT
jgi:hypothetical protein